MTVRRECANLLRSGGGLVQALRGSREALCELDDQLGLLLESLRQPAPVLDRAAPDQLRSAARRAGSMLESLGEYSRGRARRG